MPAANGSTRARAFARRQGARGIGSSAQHLVISTLICFLLLGGAESFAQVQFNALEYGIPDTGSIISYGTYVISYDGRLRSARWTAEKITKDSLVKNTQRRNNFRPDRRFPSEFRAELSDYRGSGYDRGHLAPSADHLISADVNGSTFFLTNMSPQVGRGFNRDYWRRIEASIRKLALKPEIKEVFVFTGPLFMPDDAPRQGQATGEYDDPGDAEEASEDGGDTLTMTIEFVGANHLPKPTHYFKALLVVPEQAGGVKKLYTVVVPNRIIEKTTPLSNFARSVDYLEHWAGFDLWQKLPDALEDVKEGTAWNPWGELGN